MKTTKKMYCLQYMTSCVMFMKFTVVNEETVRVHGPTGAASFVDKEMPIEEARTYWKTLIQEGYHQIPSKDAPRDYWFWN